LEFRLLFWTSNYPDWIRIQSEIVFAIHDVLYKEGISIPFPQMDLHFKSIDKSFDFGDKSKDETK
jgi:small-conductance mechanosensitive channel